MAESGKGEKKRPDPDGLHRTLIGRAQDPRTPSARLPSLRTPRDLTLKGTPKKTFKPNIPVRRERSKDNGSSSRSSSPAPSKRPRGRGRGRGRGSRGRRDRNQDLIQTHNSIFEEGPGERLVRRSTTEGFGRSSPSLSKNDFTSTTSLASTFRSLTMKREERDEEDSKNIAELLRDDFVKDSSLTVDEKYIPVRLPLKITLSSSSSSSSSSLQDITDDVEPLKVKIKEEPVSPKVKVKQEPLDSDAEMKVFDEEKKDPATGVKGSEPTKSTHPLFTRRGRLEGKLLFFQLPDSLPALPPSSDYDGHRGPDVPGTSTQSSQQPESKTDCTLGDLPSGFLGKLRVRKSGRTELQLGKITLDVNVGTPCGFLQDLVSIRDIGDEKEMVNLGQVKHRIICTPNLLSLLDNR